MADRASGAPPLPRRRRRGQLGDEVWSLLRQAGEPLTARQVLERLDHELAYSTVVTTLARMYAKGLLIRARAGRSYRYAPSTTEAGLAARRMHAALDGHGDRRTVLAHFVADLSGGDAAVLGSLLVDRGASPPVQDARPD